MTSDPMPEAESEPPTPPLWRSKPMRRLAALISAVVAGIGLVTGIIGVVPILFRNDSSVDSVRVVATPLVSGTATFALPASTDFSSFPDPTSSSCTPEQESWLLEHGRAVQERFLLEFENRATGGAMLTLRDFRMIGEASDPTDDTVRMECNPTGVPGARVQAAMLDPASAAPAIYVGEQLAGGVRPDTPLVYNLAPGELGQVVLHLQGVAAFTGDITATVVSGSERRDLTFDLGDRVTFVGSGAGAGTTIVTTLDGLRCRTVLAACPVEQMPLLLPQD